ncbi:hypothetical protein M3O96_19065, partial [Aquiflexum sp. TKW24L]|uniref:hypothetical protein n=1 Tax=Aquiflexum sp. TKW24L TaxID=2942212 RepID=UPI0020BFC59F
LLPNFLLPNFPTSTPKHPSSVIGHYFTSKHPNLPTSQLPYFPTSFSKHPSSVIGHYFTSKPPYFQSSNLPNFQLPPHPIAIDFSCI